MNWRFDSRVNSRLGSHASVSDNYLLAAVYVLADLGLSFVEFSSRVDAANGNAPNRHGCRSVSPHAVSRIVPTHGSSIFSTSG